MDVVLLTESNYEKWKSCMESYLTVEDLWDIVCGTDVLGPEDSEELKLWKKKNAKAAFILKSSISDHLFYHITDSDSASSIWTTLDALFKKIEQDRLKNLENEIAELSINKDGLGELNNIKQKQVVDATAPDSSEVDKKKDSIVESTQVEQMTIDHVAAEESKFEEQQETKAVDGPSRSRRTIREPFWMKDYVSTNKEKRGGKAKQSK